MIFMFPFFSSLGHHISLSGLQNFKFKDFGGHQRKKSLCGALQMHVKYSDFPKFPKYFNFPEITWKTSRFPGGSYHHLVQTGTLLRPFLLSYSQQRQAIAQAFRRRQPGQSATCIHGHRSTPRAVFPQFRKLLPGASLTIPGIQWYSL